MRAAAAEHTVNLKGRMMSATWDGIVSSEMLNENDVRVRHSLADAAKRYDWPCVLLAILGSRQTLVNTTRPDGSSLYAPLHQAAHGGAPVDVVLKLVKLGAWRTLQNQRGERPLDVATKKGHSHLEEVLTPVMKRNVPLGVLLKMQFHFHAVIRERARNLVTDQGLRLPELEPLLEFDMLKVWFPVPGMYGGFEYHLEQDGVEAKLITESWSRVVEGAGQRHEITSAGSKLLAEGFV
jgi:hypothetical protein